MILLKNVSKYYKLYKKPSDIIKEIFLNKRYHSFHTALDDVSLEIRKGEIFGIIGQNGSGKSTLLKVITGLIKPDKGDIFVDGKVVSILELGTGFNFEMSGYENIYLNGQLIGMDKSDIDREIDNIIEFSELRSFIYEPLRTYSSGMVVRLAFSIAIHSKADYFIIDEALSVGDAYFQQKSFNRIKQLRESGTGVIFVSHDLNAVKVISDRVALLDKGKVISVSDPETAINTYYMMLASLGKDIAISERGYGSFEVEITAVYLDKTSLSSGDYLTVSIEYYSKLDVEDLTIGILIRDRFGIDIFGVNTNLLGYTIMTEKGGKYRSKFKLKVDLSPGKYTISVAIHKDEYHSCGCFHWWDNAVSFEVEGYRYNRFVGLLNLKADFYHDKI